MTLCPSRNSCAFSDVKWLRNGPPGIVEVAEFNESSAHGSTMMDSGQGYHWNSNAETYYLIGEAMGEAMKRLLGAK